MSKVHRVLAAVDFSAPAKAAFDHALALSHRHGAELTVVHAVPSDMPFKWHARERHLLIAELRAAAEAAGVPFKASIQSGDPAGVILLHANARRADLIVLGASERTGFDRWRFGSVAETVAMGATQPVLVIPAAATSATAFNSILVAVDLRPGSTDAVEQALSMAHAHTRVTVLHAVPAMAPIAGAHRYMYHLMEPRYLRRLARDAWRRIADIIPAAIRTSRPVRARVVTGDPSAEISRVAADVSADLILVGVTTRSAIARFFRGSTAARVMRTAGAAVLTLPQPPVMVAATDDNRFAVAA